MEMSDSESTTSEGSVWEEGYVGCFLTISRKLFLQLSCNLQDLHEVPECLESNLSTLKSNWVDLIESVNNSPSKNMQPGRHTELFLEHFFQAPYLEYLVKVSTKMHATICFKLKSNGEVDGTIKFGNKSIGVRTTNLVAEDSIGTLQELIDKSVQLWTGFVAGTTESPPHFGRRFQKKKHFVKKNKRKSLKKPFSEYILAASEYVDEEPIDDFGFDFEPQPVELAVNTSLKEMTKSEKNAKKRLEKDARREEKNRTTNRATKSAKEKKVNAVRLSNNLCNRDERVFVYKKLIGEYSGARFRSRWKSNKIYFAESAHAFYSFERDWYVMKRRNQKEPSASVELKYNTSLQELRAASREADDVLDAAHKKLHSYLLGDLQTKYLNLKSATDALIDARNMILSRFLDLVKDESLCLLFAARSRLSGFPWKELYLTYECAHYLRSKVCLTWSNPSSPSVPSDDPNIEPLKYIPEFFNISETVQLKYSAVEVRFTPDKQQCLNIIVSYGNGAPITMEGNSHQERTVEINMHEKLQTQPEPDAACDSSCLALIGDVVKSGNDKMLSEFKDSFKLEQALDPTYNLNLSFVGQSFLGWNWDKVYMTR